MNEQGFRIAPVALERRELGMHFGFAFVVLLAVYSATLIYPYLLSDETWTWRIGRNYVGLGPGQAHVIAPGQH